MTNPANKNLNDNKIYSRQILIEDIINGMYDWVRVIDRNNTMMYANKAMSDALGKHLVGEECYRAIGKDEPCENCVSRQAVFKGYSFQKEEVIGDKIFSVMGSPVKNEHGEIIASVEVLRNITQMKHLQQKLEEQNIKLINDLTLAKKLQYSLLPKKMPGEKISLSFIYRPCEALGGDFLDIFRIDEDHVGTYIADVSGHGISASMLTVFLRSSINKKTLSPSEALHELFKDFNNSGFNQDLYITVFYAVLNTSKNTLTYSNAGHNVCPIIFGKDRFELLRIPGIPISNWLDSPTYMDKKTTLSPGDRIFFYTDGIVEIRNEKNEQFGEERLLDILLNDMSEPNVILNKIVDEAYRFAGIKNTADVLDDIILALLEMH